MPLSLHRLKLYRKTMDGLLDTAFSNNWTTGQQDKANIVVDSKKKFNYIWH